MAARQSCSYMFAIYCAYCNFTTLVYSGQTSLACLWERDPSSVDLPEFSCIFSQLKGFLGKFFLLIAF